MEAPVRKNLILIPNVYDFHGVRELLDSFCEKNQLDYYFYSLHHLKQSLDQKALSLEFKNLIQKNQILLFLVPVAIQVNQELVEFLNHQPRSFGSPSTGLDHVDQSFLREVKIPFFSAEGENRDSVVEYVLTALSYVLDYQRWRKRDFCVGIIGYGRIGSLLGKILKDFGIPIIAVDPFVFPKEYKKNLEEIRHCDVITFHVPLTKDQYPTYHMVDLEFLKNLKSSIIINTSRGKIFTEEAYLYCIENFDSIMDVYYFEPPKAEYFLSKRLKISTPHTAGYHWQSRFRGMFKILKDFSHHFQFEFSFEVSDFFPKQYEIEIFSSIMEETTKLKQHVSFFSKIRSQYPIRAGIKEQKYQRNWDPIKKELYDYFMGFYS